MLILYDNISGIITTKDDVTKKEFKKLLNNKKELTIQIVNSIKNELKLKKISFNKEKKLLNNIEKELDKYLTKEKKQELIKNLILNENKSPITNHFVFKEFNILEILIKQEILMINIKSEILITEKQSQDIILYNKFKINLKKMLEEYKKNKKENILEILKLKIKNRLKNSNIKK